MGAELRGVLAAEVVQLAVLDVQRREGSECRAAALLQLVQQLLVVQLCLLQLALFAQHLTDLLERLQEELLGLGALAQDGGGQRLHLLQLLVLDLDQSPQPGAVQGGLLELLAHGGLELLGAQLEAFHVHGLLLLQLVHPFAQALDLLATVVGLLSILDLLLRQDGHLSPGGLELVHELVLLGLVLGRLGMVELQLFEHPVIVS
mmetsp:Transcript_31711/g.43274  ORF Transcript_31711/g.43274 Transcript_31711/m.43274 type:complete len:204 (+) Transcript_31711:401-1012(+)